MGIGLLTVKVVKLPQWVTSAVCFNNATSLPLPLVQPPDATGILSSLGVGDDSTSDGIQRAKSYFLVCATVGNSMIFTFGPRLMDAENTPEDHGQRRK
jgi:auxin efflux carrier family protein